MRIRTLAVLALLALLPLAALATEAKKDGDVVIIEIKDYKFIPAEVTVKVGTTVRWENHERRQFHNIYFEGLEDESGDYFFPDEFRERTFDKVGTFPYICEPHDDSHQMRGVIHVVE